MKPIPTDYAGCRFRSRTEARWAVFFNSMHWRWDFEPEGFRLKSGNYLPDFRVWTNGGSIPTWFEVKPFKDGCPEDKRWRDLAVDTDKPIIIAYGMHRTGDGCEAAWKHGRLEPHAGRLIMPSGVSYMMGPFWTSSEYTHAWDKASGARFEFGESG